MVCSYWAWASSYYFWSSFCCLISNFFKCWSNSFLSESAFSFYNLSVICVLSCCSISLVRLFVSSVLNSRSIRSLANFCICSSRSDRSSLKHSSLAFSTLLLNSDSNCCCFWFPSWTASSFSSSTWASSYFWKFSFIWAACIATCSASFCSYKLCKDCFDCNYLSSRLVVVCNS